MLVLSGDATASSPSLVVLYRVDAPRRAPIEIHDSDARSAAFAPKGHGILTIDKGGEVRLWDASISNPIHFDTAGVSSIGRAAVSPDATRFATADADGPSGT